MSFLPPSILSVLSPSSSINYKVIFLLYACCCLLSVLFYFLEYRLVSRENENFASIEGVHIIFAPFWPAAAWAAGMCVWKGRLDMCEEGKKKKE